MIKLTENIFKPNWKEVIKNSQEFYKVAKRDVAYRVGQKIIGESWNDSSPFTITEGVLTFILIWNMEAYGRGKYPKYENIESFIQENKPVLNKLRKRVLLSFNEDDEAIVRDLYEKLLEAGRYGKKKTKVGTAKALHILAPKFFPIWDSKIIKAFKVGKDYIKFMKKIKNIVNHIIEGYFNEFNVSKEEAIKRIIESCSEYSRYRKTLPKIIDEYYYSVL